MRVGEFALAFAQAGEVEAQRRDAVDRQALGDALCRAVVLAAGEAMREQREGIRLAERKIDQGRQSGAARAGELKPLGAHADAFRLAMS